MQLNNTFSAVITEKQETTVDLRLRGVSTTKAPRLENHNSIKISSERKTKNPLRLVCGKTSKQINK